MFHVGPAMRYSNLAGRILTLPLKVRELHNKKAYDLIHAHSILGGSMGKVASKLISRPLLFTVHGSPHIESGVKNINYLIESLIHRLTPYNQVISEGKINCFVFRIFSKRN